MNDVLLSKFLMNRDFWIGVTVFAILGILLFGGSPWSWNESSYSATANEQSSLSQSADEERTDRNGISREKTAQEKLDERTRIAKEKLDERTRIAEQKADERAQAAAEMK